jgi:hypothetical protein
MLVDGGAVWENDRGDGKSLVRDDVVSSTSEVSN